MTEGEPDGAEYDEKHVELLRTDRWRSDDRGGAEGMSRLQIRGVGRASENDDVRGGKPEYSYS
jgi:hypothetical protein